MQGVIEYLNNGFLVQIDTPEDSYYLGTCRQVKQLGDTLREKEHKVENESVQWCWSSDSDLCVSRLSGLPEPTVLRMTTAFQHVVHPLVIRGIFLKNAVTGETETTVMQYIPKPWDAIFADGSLLMGSIDALLYDEYYDCIVNCSTNIKCPKHIMQNQQHQKSYIQLWWEDVTEQEIINVAFENVIQTIYNWIHVEHKRVLVHCEQGISRSGALVLGYLMQTMCFKEALEHLQQKRPIAKPNVGFLKQLQAYKPKKTVGMMLVQ